MKMKLVLVENDETLCTELKELLAFYNVFDIVHTFDGINEANKYICLNEVDAVFINIKTGNPRYSGDGSFLAYNKAGRPGGAVFGRKVRGGAGI